MGEFVIGIATTGRAAVLREIVAWIDHQTRPPDRIIISAIGDADVAGVDQGTVPREVITTGRGLTQQRNRILDRLGPDDILLFIDDDFLLDPQYVERTQQAFDDDPTLVMTTGRVLADGILGPGLGVAEGKQTLETAPTAPADGPMSEVYNGYGCNMAVRMAPIVENDLRFDEVLPLYCWLEDVDFSRVLAGHGHIAKLNTAMGVHLGVKSGRTSGVKLGYSQMVNPVYLMRKGTLKASKGFSLMGRNIAANLAKSFWPEPYIDRRGRLWGNVRGIGEILAGRANPSRILDF